MHMTRGASVSFIRELLPQINTLFPVVGIAPPFTSIEVAAQAAKGSRLLIGAQNISGFPGGAHTGEISALMLQDVGAQFVLIGHSERRVECHETDLMIRQKIGAALTAEIMPILCVGEREKDEGSETKEGVVIGQLGRALLNLSSAELKRSRLMIAYEPVWAIGSGESATPEFVQGVHHRCRSFLFHHFGEDVANHLPLLYGGSVTSDNISQLISQPDVDGVLVGGGSLKVNSFVQIIKNAKK